MLIRDSIDAVIVYIDSLFPNERFFGKIGSCYQRRLYALTCLANTTYPKDVYVHEFSMVIHALFTTNKAGAAAETYELRYLHGKGRGLNQRGLVKEESFNIAEELQHGTREKIVAVFTLHSHVSIIGICFQSVTEMEEKTLIPIIILLILTDSYIFYMKRKSENVKNLITLRNKYHHIFQHTALITNQNGQSGEIIYISTLLYHNSILELNVWDMSILSDFILERCS